MLVLHLDKPVFQHFLSLMKAIFVGTLILGCSIGLGLAQNSSAGKPAAATATTTSTNKPDIKELIKAGSFTNDTGMVIVKISPVLWAGKFEVTQEEYQKIMGTNPSDFKGDRNPVDSVSWNDAVAFCAKLNEAEKKTEMLPEGFVYGLPTQAQWEMLMDGADLNDAVTSEKTSRTDTAPVGSLKPNSLGLFDTRG